MNKSMQKAINVKVFEETDKILSKNFRLLKGKSFSAEMIMVTKSLMLMSGAISDVIIDNLDIDYFVKDYSQTKTGGADYFLDGAVAGKAARQILELIEECRNHSEVSTESFSTSFHRNLTLMEKKMNDVLKELED